MMKACSIGLNLCRGGIGPSFVQVSVLREAKSWAALGCTLRRIGPRSALAWICDDDSAATSVEEPVDSGRSCSQRCQTVIPASDTALPCFASSERAGSGGSADLEDAADLLT